MSTSVAGPRKKEWWVRPGIVLPILASILLTVVLLTPESAAGRLGDSRLSSHLSGPLGARALKDVALRFGWRVRIRDSTAVPVAAPGVTVHAVLAPVRPVTPAQAHRYMEAIRQGDALLLVLDDRNPLSDSLGIRHARLSGVLATQPADSAGCGVRRGEFLPSLWPDGQPHLFSLAPLRDRSAQTVTFARIHLSQFSRSRAALETAVGFPLGRGRVAVVADPDLLRIDVLRHCAWGADVVAMRMLEWLRAGGDQPRATLEFDEFHQGFGPVPSTTSVVRRFLGGHPVGRTILQLGLAALVLLLALAPRPIAPRPRPRTERRDPLEQADALAHAYQQVRATRTATQRLVHAVRSRVERAGQRGHSASDAEFLALATLIDPARRADVDLVQRALRAPTDSDTLPEIGAALRRIESSLMTTTYTTA